MATATIAKWIGLFEVLPFPGADTFGSDQNGARVVIVGLANDETEFLSVAQFNLAQHHLEIVDFEDIELYRDWLIKTGGNPAVVKLADSLQGTKRTAAFGDFYVYPLENESASE